MIFVALTGRQDDLLLTTSSDLYFEKLRSSAQRNRRNGKGNQLRATNILITPRNSISAILESRVHQMQTTSQLDFLLSELLSVKEANIGHVERHAVDRDVRTSLYPCTVPIVTTDGCVMFDFGQQAMNDEIYIRLLQLVRLSELDQLIEKIFHGTGEYHHVGYREKRRIELQKEKEKHRTRSTDRFYGKAAFNRFRSPSSASMRSRQEQSSHESPLKVTQTNKTDYCITMARAVHFRASSHCFVLEGIDISSRFQYDRSLIRTTCLGFYKDVNSDSRTTPDGDLSPPCIAPSQDIYECLRQVSVRSGRNVPVILVLCTERMKRIYQLLELLLKSYVSSTVSVVYVAFEEIQPFLAEAQLSAQETLRREDRLKSSTVLHRSDNSKKSFATSAGANDGHQTAEESEQSPKIEESNLAKEEALLNGFRSSSLVLILMKQLDEDYLLALIRWYADGLHESYLQSELPLISEWTEAMDHFWLITRDYQRARTVFHVPKTNLFLWPTDHNEIDHASIIISSILVLPIALSINYEIYIQFIDGMAIVDQHCRTTTMDQNICVRTALLQIWSSICGEKAIEVVTDDGQLEHFRKYVHMLRTEYEHANDHSATFTNTAIQEMFQFQQDGAEDQHLFSYNFVTIANTVQRAQEKWFDLAKSFPRAEKFNSTSRLNAIVSLEQFTPLTFGILIGVYQTSIFFESIIREHISQMQSKLVDQ